MRFFRRLWLILNPPRAEDDRWFVPGNVPVPQGLDQPIHESWLWKLPERYQG